MVSRAPSIYVEATEVLVTSHRMARDTREETENCHLTYDNNCIRSLDLTHMKWKKNST